MVGFIVLVIFLFSLCLGDDVLPGKSEAVFGNSERDDSSGEKHHLRAQTANFPNEHHYYTSEFHHSKDRRVVLQLDREYFNQCSTFSAHHCEFHRIQLTEITYETLRDNVDRFTNIPDREESRIYISVEVKKKLDFSMETSLNRYFSERPFFNLVYINTERPSIKKDLGAITFAEELTWMIFRLVPPSVRRALTIFSHFYFPASTSHCETHPLTVDMDRGGTWGNRFGITADHAWIYREAVFMTFIADHCENQDFNRFASHDICPRHINKFECLFLPGTNCTLPTKLTDCKFLESLPDAFPYFTNATETGEMVSEEMARKQHEENEAKGLSKISLQSLKYDNPYKRFRVKSYSHIHPKTIEMIEMNEVLYDSYFSLTYLYGIHYRMSFSFAVHVYENVRQSRISSYFGILQPNESCVAIHMRKDDRQIPGMNMRKWCEAHTRPDRKPGMSIEELAYGTFNGTVVDDGMWMDYGCLYRIPYGDLSLEHFLNASLAMFPDNRNIFVMTDDPRWLDRSVERVFGLQNISHAHSLEEYDKRKGEGKEVKSRYAAYDKLRVFTLASVRNDRKYEANVEFWASIELVRQCESLIIHPGSAVGRFIALSACYRSGQSRYMHCPDLLDISGGELY
eukprot:gene10671-11624_t